MKKRNSKWKRKLYLTRGAFLLIVFFAGLLLFRQDFINKELSQREEEHRIEYVKDEFSLKPIIESQETKINYHLVIQDKDGRKALVQYPVFQLEELNDQIDKIIEDEKSQSWDRLIIDYKSYVLDDQKVSLVFYVKRYLKDQEETDFQTLVYDKVAKSVVNIDSIYEPSLASLVKGRFLQDFQIDLSNRSDDEILKKFIDKRDKIAFLYAQKNSLDIKEVEILKKEAYPYSREYVEEQKKIHELEAKKRDGKFIAITFDDGPHKSNTYEILDCLKKNDAKATFFLLGTNVINYPDVVQAIENQGSEIGNHSYDHSDLTTLTPDQVRYQIDETDQLIEDIVHHKPKVFRNPYGATNENVNSLINRPIIFWDIDTLDWSTRNAQTTINTILENASDGDIVLMHDIHKESKDAALKVIPELKNRGFNLVTVSELFEYKGIPLMDGKIYTIAN